MSGILPLFLALIGVIALMVGVIFIMKWLTGRTTGSSGAKGLKVASCMGVGQDKSVMAVKAGTKNLLIGVCPSGISLICELSEEDMKLICGEADGEKSADAPKSFADYLKLNTKKVTHDFFTPYTDKSSGDKSSDRDDNSP